jgi:CRISPR-associated endonuclease/helicase Cas3
MTGTTVDHFDEYFHELHGHSPYPWQRRVAERAVRGEWPPAMDLPTGSGKTACIDIAIFALACQAPRATRERNAPRRVFFCVNRRVIVDEAHQRARRIARAIAEAEKDGANGKPVLRMVAAALRELGGTTPVDRVPPLDVLELRGGIYRDNRWARSSTQPTVICTTLDQLGSRLLFRGYGVSPNAAPVQAALVAHDSLVILDEAHISEPFRQTLHAVQRYLDPAKWAEEAIGVRPMVVVPMTATPPPEANAEDVIRLRDDDRRSLSRRLSASKPAVLRSPVRDVAAEAAKVAGELARKMPSAIGVIVNRVATAKRVHEELGKSHPQATVELVIGSMRPVDRDEQAERLRAIVGPDRPAVTNATSFVVATQCLEVGADYDFDVLVSECASLDALRQRFGRLNRAGRLDATGQPVRVHAVILADTKAVKPSAQLDDDKPLDPIYGNALARTWNWLDEHATGGSVDFGIDVFDALLQAHGDGGRIPRVFLAPSASAKAPVMLPAYLDLWCQTTPCPLPDPDVSLFIHGPRRGEPDVQICWRADLGTGTEYPAQADWCEVVALLPPTAAECMSVPISRLRRWLTESEETAADHGDLLGIAEEDDGKATKVKKPPPRKRDGGLRSCGVLWRGRKGSRLIQSTGDLRPGDTLVLPAEARGWSELGHLPNAAAAPRDQLPDVSVDRAEHAFAQARDRAVLRVHTTLRRLWPVDVPAIDELFDQLADHENRPRMAEIPELVRNAAEALEAGAEAQDQRLRLLKELAASKQSFFVETYPGSRGMVLRSRGQLGRTRFVLPSLDDGEDTPSRAEREDPVSLKDHTIHVTNGVARILHLLPFDAMVNDFHIAASLHDLGKADERFQAMLRRTDRTDAWLGACMSAALLAKSDSLPLSSRERNAARVRAGFPSGFRHEMLSVQIAERSSALPRRDVSRDLVLHLIAAHHGHARPFAPVVYDDDPPEVEIDGVMVTAEERRERPPHRLDSGIAERFWSLTRRYGWWGLAYLEALLRLADQQASAAEDAGGHTEVVATAPAEVKT